MVSTLRRMPRYFSDLHKLLDDHGIHSIRELCELTGLSSQQGWNLWHGKGRIGIETLQRLHAGCGISYDELMALPSIPKPKPRGPRKRPPEEETHA